MSHPKYLTVSALTKYLKKKLEVDPHLRRVYLKGEISNFKHHTSGHMYLTIKDETAQIRAVMFYPANLSIKFNPENGMKLLFTGHVSLYEKSGQYQFYISEMTPDGIGALYLAYEQLKVKLSKEGLFDPKHKKKIPRYPNKIAVLTSSTGAAIKDIITTIKNKYPIVEIIVLPIIVQGEQAKDNIVEAIKQINLRSDIDTIILGRGGGSIEDLWAFNEEVVARAIYDSTLPIITGIGHETDFTISDFVSDYRAPTPTAAANEAVPSLKELTFLLNKYKNDLINLTQKHHTLKTVQLNQLKNAYVFQKPAHLFNNKQIYLDQLQNRLQEVTQKIFTKQNDEFYHLNYKLLQLSPKNRINQEQLKLNNYAQRLSNNYMRYLERKQQKIALNIDKLQLLDPLKTMKRGYSITYNKNQKIVSQIHQVKLSEQIDVQLTDGTLKCTVNSIRKDER